jgi:hypothetical protein
MVVSKQCSTKIGPSENFRHLKRCLFISDVHVSILFVLKRLGKNVIIPMTSSNGCLKAVQYKKLECLKVTDVYLDLSQLCTQKNFETQKSIFVCCTEDIYKFVSRSYLFECSLCGTRPDSTVT